MLSAMIVCPTTHNDWDWQVTFETYYSVGAPANNKRGLTQCVRAILDSVTTLFAGTQAPDTQFTFSYAEVGFLRQYLIDYPEKAAVFRAAGTRFCLLGGGITSPDNQACHGEVFIRNYLTGHEFLRSVGLIDQVFFVAWLPDDFGHDPQLPVLVEALGMSSIGLSRIPGSPQPMLCPSLQPANNAVRANGVTFHWSGNDGSKVLTHFMPNTYFGITNFHHGLIDTKGAMTDFLQNDVAGVAWPGDTIFATQGGDWQFPESDTSEGHYPGFYNWSAAIDAPVSYEGISVTSRLGTFADYYQVLMQQKEEIKPFVLFAENYWTGYFASRPQLKIDQYTAAQLLLGAEVLGSILTVYKGSTREEQAALAGAIADGWHLLVPTTHHDFITGTSQDSVYQLPATPDPKWDADGQLSMSGRAVKLAAAALELAMQQLAALVTTDVQPNEIAVVVFNQTGCDLPDTALVELADPSAGQTDYQVLVGGKTGPVQRSSTGTLLFQVPGMQSMSYQVVYLQALGPSSAPAAPVDAQGVVTLSNGSVELTLSQEDGWAITQLAIGSDSYVQQDGTCANRIGIWNDMGNIYQFGMEFMNGCNPAAFGFTSFPAGASGQFVEQGPVRWRFAGQLEQGFATQYDLIRGETLVRMTTSGAAAVDTSVLVSFPMQTASGATADVLEYGTSYYWENRNPQQSWTGLTFRSCRNFAQLATSAGDAVAAVYHNGIPAWTIDGSILRGCLLRNTPNGPRGATGHDNDSHVQSYTLDVQGQLAGTGYPLRTALYAQTPLAAIVVADGTHAVLPAFAQLASVAQPDAVLRVGKTSERGLILRIQQPRTELEPQQLDINLPFLPLIGTPPTPEIVTALETAPARQTPVTLTGQTASFFADRAVWTMRVPLD